MPVSLTPALSQWERGKQARYADFILMRIKHALLPFVFLCVTAAHGDEAAICYDYGCASTATVHFRGAHLLHIKNLLSQADSAAAERQAIAQAIGVMQVFAGEQSPIFNDKGGNLDDDGVAGRMDCVDHAHTTSAFLNLLAGRGWLKFHEIREPASRPYLLISSHWAAHIAEIENGQEFIVDAWFFDHGHPASIFALEDWMNGAEPDWNIRLAWQGNGNE